MSHALMNQKPEIQRSNSGNATRKIQPCGAGEAIAPARAPHAIAPGVPLCAPGMATFLCAFEAVGTCGG
jgi:hypothetical protein